MNISRLLPFGLAAVLGACGGSQASSADFASAAPSYSNLALAQNDGDAVPATAPSGSDTATQQNATAPSCHPHLMDRAHDIMARVNRHFHKHLAHVEDLVQDHAKIATGTAASWGLRLPWRSYGASGSSSASRLSSPD